MGMLKIQPHCGSHENTLFFRDILLRRLKDCTKLNTEYQNNFHKTKKRLNEDPEEKQFEFRSVENASTSEKYFSGAYQM